MAKIDETIYLFGGRTPNAEMSADMVRGQLVDNKVKWTILECSGDVPPPHFGAALVALPDNRLLLFGGARFEEKRTSEWWKTVMNPPFAYILDSATLQWSKYATPESVNRVYHKAMWLDDRVCILGGAHFREGILVSPFNNIVLWNITTDNIDNFCTEFPLWGFCHLVELLPNKLVMVGGVTEGDQWNKDMYILNFSDRTLEKSPSSIIGDVCGAVVSRAGIQTAILINEGSIVEIKGAESPVVVEEPELELSSAEEEESDNEQSAESDDTGNTSTDESADEGGNSSAEGSIPDVADNETV